MYLYFKLKQPRRRCGVPGAGGGAAALVKANKDNLAEVVRLNMAHLQLRRRNALVCSLMRQASSLPFTALKPGKCPAQLYSGGGGIAHAPQNEACKWGWTFCFEFFCFFLDFGTICILWSKMFFAHLLTI